MSSYLGVVENKGQQNVEGEKQKEEKSHQNDDRKEGTNNRINTH